MSTNIPSLLSLSTNKADDSAVVHNTGTETIAGVKTFSSTIQGDISGNASTATALQNARTIGGVSFDGTGNIVPQTIQSINEAADTTCYPLFISNSGSQSLQPLNNAGFIYNAAANSLTATTFIGALNGNATTSTTATNATNIGITDDTSTSATFYPVIVSATSGNLPAKVSSTHFLINPSTGRASLTFLTVSGGTTATSPTLGTLIISGGLATSGNIVMGKNGSIGAGDFFIMGDTSQTSGGKYWGMQPSGVNLYGYTLDDTFTTTTNWIQVIRSGASITSVTFPNGNVNITGLTASNIVMTDSSKNLISLAILTSVNGGTGNGFTKFSGAATTEKTYTLPNASTTILTTNAAVTAAQGGTGLDSSAWVTGDVPYISATGVWNHLAGNTTTTKQYLSSTGTGSAAQAPAWATISGADITGAALTAGNDTNVTLTLGGTPATSLLRSASITAGWSGTLANTRGGIGLDSSAWAQGDLVYISATGTWNHLAKNTTATRYLANTGSSNNPAWDQINLANGVTGTLANANTTAVSTNTASTIVLRDSNGAFSMGALNCYDSGVSTNGTSAVILVNGAGSTTNAGATANFSSGSSNTAANIYGISVEKFGTEVLYMGVNKNTTTGSVPASTCFISTYQSTGKMAIGRGGSNSLPSTADILLNGDGTVTFGSTIRATAMGIGVAPIASTLTFANSTSSPLPRLILYSVANNDHQYLGFGISSATLRYQVPDNVTDHIFYAASSTSASTQLFKVTGKGSVVCNSAAIATNATDGFLYFPTCAGTPTGAPTANTGSAAMVYDTTANKIWVYNGSWRGIVVV